MLKFILFLVVCLSTYIFPNDKKLEYDVKYSDNNFIFINISKSKHPNIEKKYHIVSQGEDLEDISDNNKIEIETLEKINNVSRFDRLKPGTVIHFVPADKGEDNEKKSI